MREIKFRAWDKRNKRMKEVCQVHFIIAEEVLDPAEILFEGDCDWGFLGKDIILLQFTGLKDKSGKEIYEGDILGISGVSGVSWEVNWDNTKTDLPVGFVFGSFGMKANTPQHLHPDINKLKIIGNIYENSELLNGND